MVSPEGLGPEKYVIFLQLSSVFVFSPFPFWDLLGIGFGVVWAPILRDLGPILGGSWAILAHLPAILSRAFWHHFGILGDTWAPLAVTGGSGIVFL